MPAIDDYRDAVHELLAATIQEVEARDALSRACEAETNDDPLASAVAQQKRLAVYAADNSREEAAERYVRAWKRVGGKHVEVSA